MNCSPSIKEISLALVKAQSKMGGAVKGASNPYFKSKYSDLNSVIEACKVDLNDQGISVLQPVCSDEHGDYVETILLHTSGEFLSSRMKLRTQKENDMQAYGSAISYARRYGLQAMVFIPSSDDDDGEKTMDRSKSKTETKVTNPVTNVSVTTKTEDLGNGEVKLTSVGTSSNGSVEKPKTGFAAYKQTKSNGLF